MSYASLTCLHLLGVPDGSHTLLLTLAKVMGFPAAVMRTGE